MLSHANVGAGEEYVLPARASPCLCLTSTRHVSYHAVGYHASIKIRTYLQGAYDDRVDAVEQLASGYMPSGCLQCIEQRPDMHCRSSKHFLQPFLSRKRTTHETALINMTWHFVIAKALY